jgi:hypothetical protein
VKVTFPLPNGNASVFLDPVAHRDGSLELVSAEHEFGGSGFYFVVVRTRKRSGPSTFPSSRSASTSIPRWGVSSTPDHVFRLWKRVFLRPHYAMPLAG